MSFYEQRQSAIQNGALALGYFAEDAFYSSRSGTEKTARVKITHRQFGSANTSKLGGNAAPLKNNTLDEMEQVEIMFSLDPTFDYSIPRKPDPGDKIIRTPARDPDQRPFLFTGEVVYQGDLHGAYVFQRPRRFIQGKSQ